MSLSCCVTSLSYVTKYYDYLYHVLSCVGVVDVSASVSIIVILMTLYCNVSDSSVRP